MKNRVFIVEFAVIFLVTFLVSAIVSYCWNFFINGLQTCNWTLTFRFAILFAIICPVLDVMKYQHSPGD